MPSYEPHDASAEEVGRARAREQQLRAAFDHAPIGIAVIGLAPGSWGQYARANAAFCEMLGRDEVEIGSLSPMDVTHPDDRARESSMLQRIARREIDSVTFEKRFLHKDGHSVLASVTARIAPREGSTTRRCSSCTSWT
ncbi:MAG: PAS domain S-box protein [Chloroflexota bacterium]|nr:PAS domain S-box protein [Chloroflexota bacterium]